MAIQQGRCKNCGSIIMVDQAKDDAVCMFCWAHTSPGEAVAIDADPSAYSFPNEVMPEPTGEEQSLAFAHVAGKSVPGAAKKSQPAPKKQKAKRMSPAEKVAQAKREVIEPKMDRRQMLRVASGLLATALILAALIVPSALSRNGKRRQIKERIGGLVAGESLGDANCSIEGGSNETLVLVLPRDFSDEEAKLILNDYRALRAEVYGLSAEDAQSRVKLRLYAQGELLEVGAGGVTRSK